MRVVNGDWHDVKIMFLALGSVLILAFIFNKIYLLSQGINGRVKNNAEPRSFIGSYEEWKLKGFKVEVRDYSETYCQYWLGSLKYNYGIKLRIEYEKDYISCVMKMSTSEFHDDDIKFNSVYEKSTLNEIIINKIAMLEERNSNIIKLLK